VVLQIFSSKLLSGPLSFNEATIHITCWVKIQAMNYKPYRFQKEDVFLDLEQDSTPKEPFQNSGSNNTHFYQVTIGK